MVHMRRDVTCRLADGLGYLKIYFGVEQDVLEKAGDAWETKHSF
jgi:hypothetical protein